MSKEERKEYMRAWKREHKEEIKAYNKAYRDSHKNYFSSYNKAYRDSHKEELKSYKKVYNKAYYKTDTNLFGVPKKYIRVGSERYLYNTLKHTKLEGYEIHHCFGYDDYKCFIYIPKELHLQIHQFLRDNGISADSNHFSQIVQLINAWEGYTYIKV